jgi:hypothetical protein
VAQDAEQFVNALLAEELLVAGEPTTGDTAGRPAAPVVSTAPGYAPLQLEKYTDLADLILLDPVHDVSAAGWPSGRE